MKIEQNLQPTINVKELKEIGLIIIDQGLSPIFLEDEPRQALADAVYPEYKDRISALQFNISNHEINANSLRLEVRNANNDAIKLQSQLDEAVKQIKSLMREHEDQHEADASIKNANEFLTKLNAK